MGTTTVANQSCLVKLLPEGWGGSTPIDVSGVPFRPPGLLLRLCGLPGTSPFACWPRSGPRGDPPRSRTLEVPSLEVLPGLEALPMLPSLMGSSVWMLTSTRKVWRGSFCGVSSIWLAYLRTKPNIRQKFSNLQFGYFRSLLSKNHLASTLLLSKILFAFA